MNEAVIIVCAEVGSKAGVIGAIDRIETIQALENTETVLKGLISLFVRRWAMASGLLWPEPRLRLRPLTQRLRRVEPGWGFSLRRSE